MNALSLLITIKLAITLPLLVVPFLFLPTEKLGRLFSISTNSSTLFRLYGIAMLALATAYAGGLWLAWHGTFPWGVVVMGIVSNCGAAAVLSLSSASRVARSQALLFGAIGVGFILSAVFANRAIAPII